MSKPIISTNTAPESTGQPEDTKRQVGRGIAMAALLIAIGNIASRALGQVRESLISGLFAISEQSGAFALAARVPTTLYDLIVGGLVSAALIPVFSELAERDERELGRVAGTIFTLATVLMLVVAGGTWLVAPLLGLVLDENIRTMTVTLVRWMLPATVFMGLAGLITGLLQARQRFLLPAFSTATFNLGIIAGGVFLAAQLDVVSLAVGMCIGALGQVLLQLPGLRGTRLQLGFDLKHPDVQRIGKLYIPVMIGLAFSLIGTAIDSVLVAPLNGGAAAAQQRYATTLIQLALGIVATAISVAALPTLSRQGTDPNDLTAFRRTLGFSIKALLLFLLPVTGLLAALGYPIVSFLFQWNAASPQDAQLITLALLCYLPMLVAAGIDQPLIMAFYARRNTLLPNLVNGGAIAAYLIVAFATVRPLGVYGLILGNVVQWWSHALLMLWFAHHRLDALRGQGLGEELWKGLLASTVAGVVCWGLYQPLSGFGVSKLSTLVLIAGLGSIGLGVYVAVAHVLGIQTLQLFSNTLKRRLATMTRWGRVK